MGHARSLLFFFSLFFGVVGIDVALFFFISTIEEVNLRGSGRMGIETAIICTRCSANRW